MNYALISNVLGRLLLLLSASESICLIFAWFQRNGETGSREVQGFLISIILTIATGVLLLVLGRKSGFELLRKEAIAVVGLGWLICAVFGALPFLLCDAGLSVADSLFESMSGFTTTGSTIIADLEQLPDSLILWRCFSQWLGGMGILVLFVALLSSFGVGSKSLFRHESTVTEQGNYSTRIRALALRLWQIYILLTLCCFAGLKFLGMSVFDAVCHTFTAVATGGFGTHNESIAYFDSLWIELWLMLMMILGSINFMLYAWTLRGRLGPWKMNEVFKSYMALLVLVTAVFAVNLSLSQPEQGTFWESLRVAAFQAVAITTTTGYATADFSLWPTLSVALLVLVMIIGGCAGSTSGGLKWDRWLLFFKMARHQLGAHFRPNRVVTLRLNGNAVEDGLQMDTLFLFGMAGVGVVLGTLVVCFMEPNLGMETCLSAVIATLFNIGPGLGEVGPVSNYALLMPWTKVFLSLLMVVGRLEYFAVLVLLVPSLWKKY